MTGPTRPEQGRAPDRSGRTPSGPDQRHRRRRDPAPRAYPARRPSITQAARFGGRLPGGLGIGIVAGGAALGALITALAGMAPGTLLGAFLIIGTLAAGTVVRRDAVHLIIPAPAPAYAVAAVLAGLHSDPAATASHTALALGAIQWIASGFPAMAIGTLVAIVITVARRRRPGPRPQRSPERSPQP